MLHTPITMTGVYLLKAMMRPRSPAPKFHSPPFSQKWVLVHFELEKHIWLVITNFLLTPWHIGNILVPDQAPNISGGGFSPNHALVYATEEDVGRRTVNSVIGLDCLYDS